MCHIPHVTALIPPHIAHPRLLARPEDWPRLRAQAETDAPTRLMLATLTRRAGAILDQPLLTRRMAGRMLLMVAREALERVSVLALVARVTGDDRFARRAAAEMAAVAAFDDWNPGHFLDTAEMALAVSIGLDWLHDDLSPDLRRTLEEALMRHALAPSLAAAGPDTWWMTTTENWAQVCHGGLAAAAIVLADRAPALSERVLARSLAALPAVATGYAPDGAYPEGPMYWSYGTAYHVMLAAALERLTGTTQGIDAFPGFVESADYINHVTAPSGDYFNYGDCAARRRLQAPLFWLARRLGRPGVVVHDLDRLATDLAEYERDPGVQYWYHDMLALALLWHRPARPAATVAPRVWHGRGPVPVAVFRRQDLYLGVKGGSVGISHSHMDVGSFVLEAGGVRWAVDAGMQDYEGLEAAGVDLWNESAPDSQRWQVFRIGPDSHSILRIDGAPQVLFAKADIRDVTDAGCVIDLTATCGGPVTQALRRCGVTDTGIRVRDTWQAARPVVAASQWMTGAEVTLAAPGFVLRQGGRVLRVAIASSDDVEVLVDDVSAPARAFDAPNPGLRRVSVRSRRPAAAGWHEVQAVLLPPGAAG